MRWILNLAGVIGMLAAVHGQTPEPLLTMVHTHSGAVRGIGTDIRSIQGHSVCRPTDRRAPMASTHRTRAVDGGTECDAVRTEMSRDTAVTRGCVGWARQRRLSHAQCLDAGEGQRRPAPRDGVAPRWRIPFRVGHVAPLRWDEPGAITQSGWWRATGPKPRFAFRTMAERQRKPKACRLRTSRPSER
jgi:hypothetical protein